MDTVKERHALPKNDPRLFQLVPVKVLKPFFAIGVRLEPGTITTLPRHVVSEMQAIGKAEFLREQ